jgi:hypothetical protein
MAQSAASHIEHMMRMKRRQIVQRLCRSIVSDNRPDAASAAI